MLSEKTGKWLTKIGIVLPLIFVFYYVYKYGFTIPYWDEWEYVLLLEKFHNHTLTFTDLWIQHNEHRMIFANLLMLLLASLSGWNILLELYFSIIFAALSLNFLLSLLNDIQDSRKNSILKIVISLLMFSMIQYENWALGFSIQYYMAMTGVIAAIWSINKWQGQMRGLVIALLAAIFSIFSFGAGLFILPPVLFMLIFQKKWNFKHIIIWIVACLVIVFLYYHNYKFSKSNAPLSHSYSHPGIFIKYVLGFLGAPLGRSLFYAVLIAVISLIISMLAILDIRRVDKERLIKLIPWIAFIFYVIISACVICVGRIIFGADQALSSRYTTISTLFIISTLVLLYNSIILNLEKKKKASFKDIVFILVVSLAFLVTYVDSYKYGVAEMKRRDVEINGAAFCLKDPDNASDEDLKRLYPVPDTIRKRIKILNELGIKYDTEK
jgi:hypothetical protein